ncbi:MAG: formate dehydrogenase accessory protein FdhE [Eggerthellaceae bacterium]|nr:formate dehydrogenase accessory protein FdhE [Eggerthellaceae bacterium]
MNKEARERSLAVYLQDADEQSAARLNFFKQLWNIQEEEGQRIADEAPYTPPQQGEVVKRYWAGEPIFVDHPVPVAADDFARVCEAVAAHLRENAGLEGGTVDALAQVDWESVAHVADLKLAGTNPPEFIGQCMQTRDTFSLPASLPESVFAMVLSWALRAFLKAPATAVMAQMDYRVEGEHPHGHPILCPACGTPASASCISESSATKGGERSLYCSTCGSVWPFERIRCARCGTQNQGSLHWLHIEGDEAHRLHTCSECDGYMRTVFEGETPTPFTSMEVEDIYMVKLDALALQGDPKGGTRSDPLSPA